MKKSITTVDEYLATVSDEHRMALEKLRKQIRATAPRAEEGISYGVPTYKQNGMLVCFGDAKNHCSFYPGRAAVERHRDKLEGYKFSTGTIQFQPNRPIPAALVKQIVKERLAENESHAKKKRKVKKTIAKPAKSRSADADVKDVVKTLKSLADKKVLDSMARYAIPNDNALGISVGTIQKVAKEIGKDHELALALWKTNIYEARLLCSFIDEPDKVTAAQMDEWCNDFDSWAIVDTVCFKLFDQSPLAWRKVTQWATKRGEFQKRAAFALLASLAGHNKTAETKDFEKYFLLIEKAASDNRNFVKKGVSWALRGIGHRNSELNLAAVDLAQRLAKSTETSVRWIGKDVLRDITRPAVKQKLRTRQK